MGGVSSPPKTPKLKASTAFPRTPPGVNRRYSSMVGKVCLRACMHVCVCACVVRCMFAARRSDAGWLHAVQLRVESLTLWLWLLWLLWLLLWLMLLLSSPSPLS